MLPLVYEELRRLARAQMARQGEGQTLQPTALVHEAYLRLSRSGDRRWADRNHFLAAAAEAMRSILVDRARRRQRLKHGSGLERVEFEDAHLAGEPAPEEILAVHECVDRLAELDPQKARVVKLHFFAGLTHLETAEALGVSEKTVRRAWELARLWFYREMRGGGAA